MGLASRISWIVGLIALLAMVITISNANVINCQKVQQSIHGINNDRLAVMGLIVELSSAMHEKELAAVTADRNFYRNSNPELNEKVRVLLEKFWATRLTTKERSTLTEFQRKIEALVETESELDFTGDAWSATGAQALLKQIRSIKPDLSVLSAIQSDEGNRKLLISVEASKNMKLTSQIGKYTAIAIVLVMIGVIFFQPRKK